MHLSVSAWSFDQCLSSGRWTTAEFIAAMAELDVDAVDLNTRYLPDLSSAGLLDVKIASIEHSMPISALRIVHDPASLDTQADLDLIRRGLAACHFIGAPRMRIYGGWPAVDGREKSWTRALDTLGRAASLAGDAGVLLLLENHNHGGFLATADPVIEALDTVNSKWLSLLLDPGNFTDGMASVERVYDRASWLDFKVWQLAPDGGDASIDYVSIIDRLRAVGFDGYCSVEYEPQDRSSEPSDVQRAIKYFRSLLSPDD